MYRHIPLKPLRSFFPVFLLSFIIITLTLSSTDFRNSLASAYIRTTSDASLFKRSLHDRADAEEQVIDKDIILSNNKSMNFTGFNNVTGADRYIVPNIIHYIRFYMTEYSFVDYLCLRSAFRNHRPKHFYIHTNIDKFSGKYWEWIQKDTELMSRIRLLHLDPPSEIFGQKLSQGWRLHHGGEIEHLRVLMKFGGIYLDNDIYVVKSLNRYRKYEDVINWKPGHFIGNQVHVAHKDARFLKLYLESYRDHYHPLQWNYNAGVRPTVEILHRQPELIHRVAWKFGTEKNISRKLYNDPKFNWRKLDTIHLMINHRIDIDPHYDEVKLFDENNIRTYNYGPFGEMAREIVDEIGTENYRNKTQYD